MRTILVVDDSKVNLLLAKNALADMFNVVTLTSGKATLEYLEEHSVDLILLDLLMPEMDGKETFIEIRKNRKWKNIPIMFLTSDNTSDTEAECLAIGADDFIAKPFVAEVMKSRIFRILELYDFRTGLEKQLRIKTKQLEKLTLNSITAIANTIDAKDEYTAGHSIRVARYSEAIAKEMGWKKEEIQNLHYVALLHDIGKIGVPDSVLKKPEKLTDEEFEQIKKHPTIGGEILKDIHTIPNVEEGAVYHHERYDGKGYPYGLVGANIPIIARIICLADAYDAMTSDRVYRKKLSREAVVEQITMGLGKQFDPEIGRLFLDMLERNVDLNGSVSKYVEEDDVTAESSKLLSKVISEYTAEVKNNAQTDSLTGLYKRNSIQERIMQHIATGEAGCFFMMDMDNFKSVNDTYGHIMGDQALKAFASSISSLIRENDLAGRFGGDEFCVFLKGDQDRTAIENVANRMIKDINAKLDKLIPNNITSVSIGIATYPEDGSDFTTLYKNADRALYHIKENGKNNFHFYNSNYSKRAVSAKADLTQLQSILYGEDSERNGAMSVKYGDFGNIYSFASRYVERAKNGVQMVLFTIAPREKSADTEIIDKAMDELETSIVTTLRAADVTSKYSSVQYLVILINADIANGKKVIERIEKCFGQTDISKYVELTHDIQDIRTV